MHTYRAHPPKTACINFKNNPNWKYLCSMAWEAGRLDEVSGMSTAEVLSPHQTLQSSLHLPKFETNLGLTVEIGLSQFVHVCWRCREWSWRGRWTHGAGARCNVRSARHAQFPSSPLAIYPQANPPADGILPGKMGLEAVLVQTKHRLCMWILRDNPH